MQAKLIQMQKSALEVAATLLFFATGSRNSRVAGYIQQLIGNLDPPDLAKERPVPVFGGTRNALPRYDSWFQR